MRAHRGNPHSNRESGQVAVESAIVLPLFVFLILGILQLGLMHQARLLTKYAAYKAVRAGSLNSASTEKMERAAVAVLLPLISQDRGGGEYIKSIGSASDFAAKWNWPGVKNNKMPDANLKFAKVTICGPTKDEVGGGGNKEMDFDDPANSTGGFDEWERGQRTKLRIQVTFNYRMPIPFANWVIHASARNKEVPEVLRLGKKNSGGLKSLENGGASGGGSDPYASAASRGLYIFPIRATYTMRMQSNFFLSRNALPTSNQCQFAF
ncbi:TadE/TadG family type IV pilus assembly protein [Archangium violaceum]|uniref:TadE/TadG family type IV pilus assembly protein n=1 Tax=Archangium violaceum TaxID=83451 RepID=UPI002B2A2ADB|nr:TadE/TadG family type IV pilus assembly protein [Archangium gephyra]